MESLFKKLILGIILFACNIKEDTNTFYEKKKQNEFSISIIQSPGYKRWPSRLDKSMSSIKGQIIDKLEKEKKKYTIDYLDISKSRTDDDTINKPLFKILENVYHDVVLQIETHKNNLSKSKKHFCIIYGHCYGSLLAILLGMKLVQKYNNIQTLVIALSSPLRGIASCVINCKFFNYPYRNHYCAQALHPFSKEIYKVRKSFFELKTEHIDRYKILVIATKIPDINFIFFKMNLLDPFYERKFPKIIKYLKKIYGEKIEFPYIQYIFSYLMGFKNSDSFLYINSQIDKSFFLFAKRTIPSDIFLYDKPKTFIAKHESTSRLPILREICDGFSEISAGPENKNVQYFIGKKCIEYIYEIKHEIKYTWYETLKELWELHKYQILIIISIIIYILKNI